MRKSIRLTTVVALAIALTAGMVPFALPAAATGGAIISNGTVQLGVHNEGHLNIPGGPPSSGSGTRTVGLRFIPTGAEATAPGCLCEGWGAADEITRVTGHANEARGGVTNITNLSFTSTASTAVSMVRIGSTLEVTHDYHPSASPNLYEAIVTIKNISGATVRPLYRRVMDWDIEPTAFDEFVTVIPGTATALLYNDNNGFQSANPLAPRSSMGFTGEFIDAGPDDHGAMFDFRFPDLATMQSRTFKIFYGGAATERAALAAIVAVRAESISLGQPNVVNGPRLGIPNTFIFAFAGIGGRVFCAGVPGGGFLRRGTKAIADKLFCDTLAALQLNLPLPEVPTIGSSSPLSSSSVARPNPMNARGAVTHGGVGDSIPESLSPPTTTSGTPASVGSPGMRFTPSRAKATAVRLKATRAPAKRAIRPRTPTTKWAVRPLARPRFSVKDLGPGWLAAMGGVAKPKQG